MKISDHIADIKSGRMQEADANRDVFFELILDMGEDALPCLYECYETLRESLMNADFGGVLDEEAAGIGAAKTIMDNLSLAFYESDSALRFITMETVTTQMRNRLTDNDSVAPDPLVEAFQKHFAL